MLQKVMLICCILQVNLAIGQDTKSTYSSNLNKLKLKRIELSNMESSDSSLQNSSLVLYEALTNTIFTAWYGTPWDFNGISNTPGEGEIACGYFVSTTLKHAGFNLNRYKLAQQASKTITTAVCGKKHIKTTTTIDATLAYFKGFTNELFIVGIDYHIGFIQVENSIPYFVHADFINDKVVKEKAANSEAFKYATIYVIGQVTNNDELMRRWLKQMKIY